MTVKNKLIAIVATSIIVTVLSLSVVLNFDLNNLEKDLIKDTKKELTEM